MTQMTRYQQSDAKSWQGRPDTPEASCFFQIVKPLSLDKPLPSLECKPTFALIGFCSDEGIQRNLGRKGAAEGPNAIREVLAKLPIQKPSFAFYDAGNILCTDGDLEASQAALGNAVDLVLQSGMTPIVIGGGHELAWGHYQGIASHYTKENLGIINFDAHFDMRPLLPNGDGSSGTPFLQIALAHQQAGRRFDYNCIGIQHAGNIRQLFDTAKKHDAHMILADDLHQGFMDKCINFVDRIIDENQLIYMSLCLDVFAAPYAPGVSAPQALGLTPWQIMPLVRQLAASGKVVSYDIAELSPRFDIDHRTAKLAANFIYEIIHHHVQAGIAHGNHTAS